MFFESIDGSSAPTAVMNLGEQLESHGLSDIMDELIGTSCGGLASSSSRFSASVAEAIERQAERAQEKLIKMIFTVVSAALIIAVMGTPYTSCVSDPGPASVAV